jgi:hypothetical protein
VSVLRNDYYGFDMILEPEQPEHEDPPPIFRTWKRLYVSVIFFTCALVVALYLMTLLLNR